MTEAKKKNKGGRPTEYTPDLCDKVIPLLKQGMSMAEIGLELDTGYTTLYLWMDKHPEFMHAVKAGRELSQGWWEKEGRLSLRDKEFSSTLWYMNMKNRFGWKDKQETDHNVAESLMEKLIDKL